MRFHHRALLIALLPLVLSTTTRASAEPVTLTLGENLGSPTTLTIELSRPVPLIVEAAVQRKVRLIAFGKASIVTSQGALFQEAVVRPGAPLSLVIKGRGPVVVVAVDDQTTPSERDIFNVPSAMDKLEDRELKRYLLAVRFGTPFHDDVSHASAELAAKLFLTLDKQF